MIFHSPPNDQQLAAIGFDPKLSFGLEFEFYSDHTRDWVASEIAGTTGVRCWAESYNHDDANNWKIVTDGSLGSDDDEEAEYECENCDVERECDQECSYHNDYPQFDCSVCHINEEDRNACYEEHHPSITGDYSYCARNNEHPEYDCDDCNTSRYCDEYCSDHCEPTYSSGSGGMELVSRPLVGYDGAREVFRVLDVLNTMHPEINDNCGLHVHLSAEGLRLPNYRSLVKLYIKYERTLDEVMPHSRRASNQCHAYSLLRMPMNYTGKVKEHFRALDKERSVNRLIGNHMADRYQKLNISARRTHGTVEFRHHSGTTSFDKTIHWVALCQRILNLAKSGYKVRIDKDPLDHVLPIESLMRTVKAPPELRRYWYARHDHFHAEVEAARQAEQRRLEQEALAQQQWAREARRNEASYRFTQLVRSNPYAVGDIRPYGSVARNYNSNRFYYVPTDTDEEVQPNNDWGYVTAVTTSDGAIFSITAS